MQRYIEFNPQKFLKESKQWQTKIDGLKKELDEVTELEGRKDRCSGSGTSDKTAKTVIIRSEIESKINKYETYKVILDYALRHITEEHREVIEAFFLQSGLVTTNAKKVAEKRFIDYPKGIYKVRREAIAEFAEVITDTFINA